VTRVAILQPSYLPWKGFFHIAHEVDVFIHLDDVQYTVQDWRSRNRIKQPGGGTSWLTVPVLGSLHQRICDARIDDTQMWRKKHLRALRHSYGRTQFFERYFGELEAIFDARHELLADLDIALTERIASWLGVAPRWMRSSTSGAGERATAKTERLVGLIREVGGSSYLSGPAARSYIEPEAFAAAGIDLTWQDYSGYPEYPQIGAPFDHFVTVLDLLFSVGPEAPDYIWGRAVDQPAAKSSTI
jgi:hypothetical protein